VKTMCDDGRLVSQVSAGPVTWEVGKEGITKIEPYLEPGGLGPVLAFAVYAGDRIVQRLNWLQCTTAVYPPPEPAPAPVKPILQNLKKEA